MELNVQKFLRNFKETSLGLEALKTQYYVDYKQHSTIPSLYLLKYNQIESDFKEPIVQECRGLILDSNDSWKVVCFPFKKFHNLQEPLAAQIDWNTAKILEKLDGSLVSLWYYKDRWNVSTSGCPDGTNYINDTNQTFNSLFWMIFETKYHDLTSFLEKTYTYMFELTSPFNRVVVDYCISELTLIGVRDKITFKEIFPINEVCRINKAIQIFGTEYQIKLPKEYNLRSVTECLEAATKLDPLKNEGYVVIDADFNRIKIKSPSYITLHHIKNSSSSSRMLEVIRSGESKEFLTILDAYPELKIRFIELLITYHNLIAEIKMVYDHIKHIELQKDFALEACKYKFSSILFSIRKTNKPIKTIIKEMPTPTYLRLMELK